MTDQAQAEVDIVRLEHVVDLELAYRTEFFLVQPYATEEGSGYGEGDGTASGERMSGSVRWVNHPHRRSDAVMLPDTHGMITTGDGATVLFHLHGRTVFEGDRGGQNLHVDFEADEEPYRWLNDVVCLAEGVVDPERLVATIKVFAGVNELLTEGAP